MSSTSLSDTAAQGPVVMPANPATSDHQERGETYMPQLDGIRAVAIGLVFFTHFLPSYSRYLPSGEIGVRIFFVLSGFLITGILRGVRKRAAAVDQSLGLSLRQFYIRRSLRIFPVFYVGLAMGIFGGLLPANTSPDSIPWLLTYTSNWYTVIYDKPFATMNHLWSLCVEEQFYLLWPFVVLCVGRRLLTLSFVLIAVSIGYRLTGTLLEFRFHAIYENTLASLDALLLGAVLALLFEDRARHAGLLTALRRLGWAVGLPLVMICYLAQAAGKSTWMLSMFVGPVATAFVGVALVETGARGGKWILAPLLENAAVRWVGQISYGLYVYHMIVYGLLAAMVVKLGYQWTDLGLARTPLAFIASFAVATLSYYAMERPLNNLKGRFPYILRKRTA